MIGIDTTLLSRHALQDDPAQAPTPSHVLLDPARVADPALIDPVLLLEFVRTLMRRQHLIAGNGLAVRDVLRASTAGAFTNCAAVTGTVDSWRMGRDDLPVYLIVNRNRTVGASLTVTFDRNAATDPNPALLQI